MCGRYTLKTSARQLAKRYRVEFDPVLADALAPRHNIPPGAGVLSIWDDRDARCRKADYLHWGLVPAWAKDVRIANKLSNARSETAAEKPSFRHALRYRRCIVPADGFFEWKRDGARKQPYYFHAADERCLSLAGIWEHWQSPDGSEILSVSILTTCANALMAPVHDRIPVIIPDAELDRWLAPNLENAAAVADLLVPPAEDVLATHPVSTAVNSVAHDGPELLLPIDTPPPAPAQGELF